MPLAKGPHTVLEIQPYDYEIIVVDDTYKILRSAQNEVGHLLHCAWELNRSLCDSISNPTLDTIYERAIAAGGFGGKILGAGGGGYFLFFVLTEKQKTVTTTLSDLRLSQLGFRLESQGSRIIKKRNLGASHYPHRREQHTTQSTHFRSLLRC